MPIYEVYYPKRANTPLNCDISKNNDYYNSNINTKRIVQNKYNNNIYIETSNISSPKIKNNQLKKIKISKRNKNNITPNYSFISADNTLYKKINLNDNSFINTKYIIEKIIYLHIVQKVKILVIILIILLNQIEEKAII